MYLDRNSKDWRDGAVRSEFAAFLLKISSSTHSIKPKWKCIFIHTDLEISREYELLAASFAYSFQNTTLYERKIRIYVRNLVRTKELETKLYEMCTGMSTKSRTEFDFQSILWDERESVYTIRNKLLT